VKDRLPRGIEWLLRIGLPADQREPIAGDLAEEYGARRRDDGSMRATAALWWQAARLAWVFRWDRTARGRALPPIGDQIRRRAVVWESVWQDIAFGIRMLRRQPGFTAVALVALALGIGANTAIFSIVDAALWRPLPYPDASRIMAVAEQRPREGRLFGPVSPADFFDWRRDTRSYVAFAAYMDTPVNLAGNGDPERLHGLAVTPGFLEAIGVPPGRGRDFRPEEETIGRHRVVLLTDGLWRRRFGADPAVIGRTATIDGNAYDVVGILPPTFWWQSQPDILVPLALTDHDRTLRAAHFLDVVGRLRSGASFSQAIEELQVVGARLSALYPAENRNHRPNIRPLREALVGNFRAALLLLLGAVGFVLLIACGNVATLMLARAASRQKELSVRRAVGATRGRLVQQMLTESLVVSVLGGAAGVLVAAWSLAAFRTVLPAQFSSLPGIERVTIDLRILVAAFAISAITGLLFGVVPAFIASDQRVGLTLNEETRGSSGSARTHRLRSVLVVAEVALSLMLLAGAALLIASFRNLMEVPPGFRPEQIVTARITLPATRYAGHLRAVAFFESLCERLQSAPGVDHVAATTAVPFTFEGEARLSLEIEHRTLESPIPVRAHPRMVSTDYFVTMGIPLLDGRQFTRHDEESAPAVAIINEAAARRFWPNERPLGQRISLGTPTRWMEVVGIVGDVRHGGLDVDAEPEAYMPHVQNFTAMGAGAALSRSVVVRTTLDVQTMASLVRTAVAGIDREQPVGWVRSMDALIAESVAPRRLNLWLVSAFAFVALVLTAGGLYGVMAYLVTQRTREIGVRMALGASPSSVLRLLLRQAGAMTMLGIGAGVAGALTVSRFVAGLLFGVSASEPRVYLVVSLILAAVALLAVAVPSARATRIDPIAALRDS
jgi:putative ABC transport system permease protein